jgi:xylan 1,4-beta-xylosidase
MACQDMAGTGRTADFDFFEYSERPFRPRAVQFPYCSFPSLALAF